MATESKPPFADTRMAQFLSKHIDTLQGTKSQKDIAAELDYPRPNIISNMKRGDIRVPMEKVIPLAKALHVDPAFLFRLWLESFVPERMDEVMSVFGDLVTADEREYLKVLREAAPTKGKLPPLNEKRISLLTQAVSA